MSAFTKFNGKSLRVGQTVTADVVGAAFGYKSFIWTNDDPIIIGVMDIKKTYVQSDEVKTTASDGEPLYDTFTRGDLVSPWIYAGRCRKGGVEERGLSDCTLHLHRIAMPLRRRERALLQQPPGAGCLQGLHGQSGRRAGGTAHVLPLLPE